MYVCSPSCCCCCCWCDGGRGLLLETGHSPIRTAAAAAAARAPLRRTCGGTSQPGLRPSSCRGCVCAMLRAVLAAVQRSRVCAAQASPPHGGRGFGEGVSWAQTWERCTRAAAVGAVNVFMHACCEPACMQWCRQQCGGTARVCISCCPSDVSGSLVAAWRRLPPAHRFCTLARQAVLRCSPALAVRRC